MKQLDPQIHPVAVSTFKKAVIFGQKQEDEWRRRRRRRLLRLWDGALSALRLANSTHLEHLWKVGDWKTD